MTTIDGEPVSEPSNYTGWKYVAVLTIRSLIGDLDPDNYTYTDSRLLSLFLVSSKLVMLDTTFAYDYVVDVSEGEVTPDPLNDDDFMGLISLRASCVLLNSEMRSNAGTGKVTMKDGPSTISVDKSDVVSAIKDTSKTVCEKYELALFAYKAGQSVGHAIMGPHSPASFKFKSNNDIYGRG